MQIVRISGKYEKYLTRKVETIGFQLGSSMVIFCMRIMNELTNQYGFQATTSAMEMACTRGSINICDVSVLAARITGYGIYTPPEAGPSLAVYDEMFLKEGGAVS